MKKVLIFSHEFPPFVGGVGMVGYQLAKWMVEIGLDVTVVTRQQADVWQIPGVKTEQVKVLPKFWWASYARYFRSINLDNFDLIVLNECAPTITAGKYFSKRLLVKCVILVHGLEIENIYSRGNSLRKLFGFKRAHSYAITHARAWVPVGRHMREKFVGGSGMQLPPNKIKTIYAGVDGDDFFYDSTLGSRYRAQRGFSDSAFIIVTGSRVTAMKGYAEMLEIFGKLAAKFQSVYWVICGDGDFLTHLEDAREFDPNLKDRIILEGRCDRSRLRAIYSSSDIYFLLSNYDEALPLAYIEAQLCGLPAIGRNRAGTVETIVDGVSGCLVNSNEEASQVLEQMIIGRLKFSRGEVMSSVRKFEMRNTLEKFKDFLQ